ncbi:hypothetical protein Deima_1755 [Deinococcus maricopensis DSM 21211]|uniref:Uncharacterized protein n=1 Tax=Deinococcus maricopensis (strain DSM 21211 / LMG 22137 / NRRL B-23946 / LB-34) TaxID=709986 RepID=E8U8L5_DEIML|nr:hypothetical protein Deima_1755 [Deinococcus maricopensis DSM 21211]
MAGRLWWYLTPHEAEANVALQAPREREFHAGRYVPAVMFPRFPVTDTTPGPGVQPASIDEAIEDAAESCCGNERESSVVAALTAEERLQFFGPLQPPRADRSDPFRRPVDH